MCGIIGFNNKNNHLLKEMLKSINHRGPDDNGSYTDENVSLGHVRLSILDLSNAGHQPNSLNSLYNGLAKIINSDYKELGKKSRNRIIDNFSIKTMVKNTENEINNL